ncbi:LAME_0G17744g1_1 [Lachancea meyersii CBS 8951]|uniref:LAME_0G17744g1_1 n=1 Tax=Lachancea meyersii CBS 8951 TaxID=1266667 RepID=A0A1G4KBL0_9SACH|nr:LAME_0G17744g1_1 [Lachancea meyersii CBS 8951]
MISNGDIIASFSPHAKTFAFRSNGLQRKYVDLYPLREVSDYQVTSSQVYHIDYESDDLQLKDLKLTTWCSEKMAGSKTKRKFPESESSAGEQPEKAEIAEEYFVNIFTGGKIVVFSPSGKEIVNIIKNKQEILGVGSSGATFWILDADKTIKHFDYRSSKPLKTFHLVDGKNDEITKLQVLEWQDKVLLAVFTTTNLYIVDPSKRRPSTVVNMDLPMGKHCILGADGQLIIAALDRIHVVELKTGKIVSKWNFQAAELRYHDGKVVAQSIDGLVFVFELGSQSEICSIKCQRSKIISFTLVNSSIIIAWLNVNEPKFEHLTLKEMLESPEIVFNQESETSPDNAEVAEAEFNTDSTKTSQKSKAKVKEEDIVAELIESLDSSEDSSRTFQILDSSAWSETLIKQVVGLELSDVNIQRVFHVLSRAIAQNPWSTSGNCSLWFKWLLTLRHDKIAPADNRASQKGLKQMRSSLRPSNDAYSLLLSIKGKLDMLSEQAKLRKEFASISLNSDGSNSTYKDKDDELLQEQEPVYVNGEGDEYVDAVDYAEERASKANGN